MIWLKWEFEWYLNNKFWSLSFSENFSIKYILLDLDSAMKRIIKGQWLFNSQDTVHWPKFLKNVDRFTFKEYDLDDIIALNCSMCQWHLQYSFSLRPYPIFLTKLVRNFSLRYANKQLYSCRGGIQILTSFIIAIIISI